MQEVRALPEQLPEALRAAPRLARRTSRRRSAPATAASRCSRAARPTPSRRALGEPRFDDEGRLQLARFGRLVVANVYFPNGNGKERDNSRIPYKLDFYRALFDAVERLRRRGERVLVLGDFNTAHREIDLARPRENVETSGFMPVEREELDRWIARRTGSTRSARFEPGPGHYSWWSQRFGVRAKNVGWRIDYVLASPQREPFLRRRSCTPTSTGLRPLPGGRGPRPGDHGGVGRAGEVGGGGGEGGGPVPGAARPTPGAGEKGSGPAPVPVRFPQ